MRSILFRKDVMAWTLYDWANSAFITSITVVLLPIYYTSAMFRTAGEKGRVTLDVLGMDWHTTTSSLWGYTNSIYMILLAVAAPVLGAMADSARGKKKFLAICVIIGSTFTAALALTRTGDFLLCSGLYIVAAICWGAGNIFYDGFLPELTEDPDEMDAISSAGYGIGYAGGGLMLIANLVLIQLAEAGKLGGMSTAGATRLNFALVGGWWLLFTIPMLLAVREQKFSTTRLVGRVNFVREGFARLKSTLGKVKRLPELGKFLLAFFLYNSGVGTLMIVAAAYAKEQLGLGEGTIIGCLLMIQFVGLPAAFGFIWLARKIGNRNSIFVGIFVYCAAVVYAMRLQPGSSYELLGVNVTVSLQFWVLGFLIALVQGGTQAMSRSLFGSMVPAGMSAEFFGFFSIFNKVGPFLGPLAFAVVADLTGSPRMAILFLITFFILGFVVLLAVKKERGQQQARAFVEAVGH